MDIDNGWKKIPTYLTKNLYYDIIGTNAVLLSKIEKYKFYEYSSKIQYLCENVFMCWTTKNIKLNKGSNT